MKLQLQALGDIDPLTVPLPVGTEVTTRVDRGDVPQGAVGRVAEHLGGEPPRVAVDVVGVGVLEYLRAELVPRKAGQLRFAVRREAAWRALEGNIVLETIVGSRAWGLADASSDTDRRGVFVLPFPWTSGLTEPPSELISLDGSATYWEVGKAVRQGIRADPNTLEMLLLPSARATDELGTMLLEVADAFASREIYGTFGRYALGQLKRLSASLHLAEHRQLLLQWLRDEPRLELDAAAAKLAVAARIEAPRERDAIARAKEYIKQLYSSLFDRGLLEGRNFAALAAFAGRGEHAFDMPRELRPKNAYNLLRLIDGATRWLRTGAPAFVVAEPLRSELLAIKRGEVELSRVLARAEELATELESARADSALPARPDIARIDGALRAIRAEAARRWIERAPGAFGADAPAAVEPQWQS